MGIYLNSTTPYEEYRSMKQTRFFVDKSSIIDEILTSLKLDGQKYICITRPRRFGKTVMANMLGAYFEESVDAQELFGQMDVSRSKYYREYLNQYPVIYIDFSEISKDCNGYKEYIDRIQDGLYQDLYKAYPKIKLQKEDAIWDLLSKVYSSTKQKLIFIMDEWDALFHMSFIKEEDKENYLLFLKSMLKGKPYVELAYMTGILPIAKYSDGSELNMFDEYDMASKEKYSEYFGFLDDEVDQLYQIYKDTTKRVKISREQLREWYDGYSTAAGDYLYNPRSVVCALRDNQLANYWTSSGTYDSIFTYIKGNIADVRNDLVFMISGERIPARIQQYAATANHLHTKDQIYSAMVVYGLLTYEDGKVFIPNKELMEKFDELLLSNQNLGYVYRLAKESTRMLQATLHEDTKTMEEILSYVHDTEVPIYSYNNEVELSAIVNLVYLSARDEYRVEREDKAGKGFVDFIFYPKRVDMPGIILELKIDHTPREVLEQIKDKNYKLRFLGKLGENTDSLNKILGVGISYDKKTKEHSCEVEWL